MSRGRDSCHIFSLCRRRLTRLSQRRLRPCLWMRRRSLKSSRMSWKVTFRQLMLIRMASSLRGSMLYLRRRDTTTKWSPLANPCSSRTRSTRSTISIWMRLRLGLMAFRIRIYWSPTTSTSKPLPKKCNNEERNCASSSCERHGNYSSLYWY